MDIKRAAFSPEEVGRAIEANHMTVRKYYKIMAEEGTLPEGLRRYSYKQAVLIVQRIRRECFPKRRRMPAPDQTEILRRQLRLDGFIR